MGKRLLCALLCCVMLLTLLPVTASALDGTILTGTTGSSFFYLCDKPPSTAEDCDDYYLFLYNNADPSSPGVLERVLTGIGSWSDENFTHSSSEGGKYDCIIIGQDGIRLEFAPDKGKPYFYIIKSDAYTGDDSYYKRYGTISKSLGTTTKKDDATRWEFVEKDGMYLVKEKGEGNYWTNDANRKILSVTSKENAAVKFKIYKRKNPTYVYGLTATYGEVAGIQFAKHREFNSFAHPDSGAYLINGVFSPIRITLPCEAMKGFKLEYISFLHSEVKLDAEPGVVTRDPRWYSSRDPDNVNIVANSKEGVSGRIEKTTIQIAVYYDAHVTKSGIPVDGTQEPPDSDYIVTDPGSCLTTGKKALFCKNCGLKILEASTGWGDHNWDSPTYTWSDDHMTCTATRKCKTYDAHTETASATVSTQTTLPTCTADGKLTYTAKFTENWAATQTYSEKSGDKTGHIYGDWTSDGETGHSRTCTAANCPDANKGRQTADHVYDDAADAICNDCGYERGITPIDPPVDPPIDPPITHEHTYGDWAKNGTNHWHECADPDCPNKTGSVKDEAEHTYGDDNKCSTCDYIREVNPPIDPPVDPPIDPPITHEHIYGDWKPDGETGHSRTCTAANCTDADKGKETASHVYDDDTDTTCNDCDYKRSIAPIDPPVDPPIDPPVAHEHTYGDWKSDKTSHWKECTVSGCTNKTQAETHTFKWVVDKAATTTAKGSKHEECMLCGYRKAAVDIDPATRPTNPTKPVENKPTTSPKTGDSSAIGLWSVTLCGSLAACLALAAAQRRRKRER